MSEREERMVHSLVSKEEEEELCVVVVCCGVRLATERGES